MIEQTNTDATTKYKITSNCTSPVRVSVIVRVCVRCKVCAWSLCWCLMWVYVCHRVGVSALLNYRIRDMEKFCEWRFDISNLSLFDVDIDCVFLCIRWKFTLWDFTTQDSTNDIQREMHFLGYIWERRYMCAALKKNNLIAMPLRYRRRYFNKNIEYATYLQDISYLLVKHLIRKWWKL